MKNKKAFVLAYASVLMAVVVVLIASIASLVSVMSVNNSRVADNFYQAVAVDQTLEYFIVGWSDEQIIEYANGKDLIATVNENGEELEKTLIVTTLENDKLLLRVTISTSIENYGKVIALSYGDN